MILTNEEQTHQNHHSTVTVLSIFHDYSWMALLRNGRSNRIKVDNSKIKTFGPSKSILSDRPLSHWWIVHFDTSGKIENDGLIKRSQWTVDWTLDFLVSLPSNLKLLETSVRNLCNIYFDRSPYSITQPVRYRLYLHFVLWVIGYDCPFWLKIDENRCRSSTSRLEYYNSPGSSHQTIRSPNHNQDQSGISSNNSATDSEMGFQIISISELDETLSPVDMSPSQQCLLDSITNFWR